MISDIHTDTDGRQYYALPIKVRDYEHLISIISWLNNNVGHTKEHWQTDGPPISMLRKAGTSVTITFIIHVSAVGTSFLAGETAVILSLL